MGVTTSNRKRPEECMSVNHSPPSSSSHSQRKKPKFSLAPTPPFSTSYGAVSRIPRYPEIKPPFVREVHAPCRPRKFDLLKTQSRFRSVDNNVNFRSGVNNERFLPGVNNESFFAAYNNDNDSDIMGNILGRKYEKVKRSALEKCKSVLWSEKEVIDVEAESSREDSGVEEVVEISDSEAKVVEVGVKQRSTSSPDSALTNNDRYLKVVSDGKVCVSETHDLSSVQVYKKLLEGVRRRTSTIDRLSFEIELNESRRETFALLRPKKELIEEVPLEPFIPLTEEEEKEVSRAFSTNRRKILIAHENSNIEISGEKIQCLRPGAWLNDEVINLYLELLKEREQREPKKFLKCHFFNTFFYKKLISGRNGYDFKSVRRWTSQKKLGYDLFDCDKIFVPIHQEIHWCLAVINKKDAKFQYLDSLKGKDNQVLKVLARYFVDEVKDKSGKDIDVSTWEKEFVEDLPEQENGFDCGVFMIKYADFYSRGLGLCFNQEHMPYFRLRTVKELLRLKAD